MKWLEVITVRSAGSNVKILAKTLQDLMAAVPRHAGKEDILIFHRENVEDDICIVKFHRGKETQTGGRPSGLRIIAVFKESVLVHHVVWIELGRETNSTI